MVLPLPVIASSSNSNKSYLIWCGNFNCWNNTTNSQLTNFPFVFRFPKNFIFGGRMLNCYFHWQRFRQFFGCAFRFVVFSNVKWTVFGEGSRYQRFFFSLSLEKMTWQQQLTWDATIELKMGNWSDRSHTQTHTQWKDFTLWCREEMKRKHWARNWILK